MHPAAILVGVYLKQRPKQFPQRNRLASVFRVQVFKFRDRNPSALYTLARIG